MHHYVYDGMPVGWVPANPLDKNPNKKITMRFKLILQSLLEKTVS
jgi:hypothetical protein